MNSSVGSGSELGSSERRLSSWKEIGSYLGCDARTAQRWEKTEGLPVHRHKHNTLSSVYAYSSELDAWRDARRPASPVVVQLPAEAPPPAPVPDPLPVAPLPATQAARRKSVLLFLTGVVIVLAAGVFWSLASPRMGANGGWIPQPITSWFGVQTAPSFSPDGSQVAFIWNGERQDNFDIYVMTVGASQPLRLTTDPAPDYSPAWSPDGRWIAFLRVQPGGIESLILTPPLGGSERVLTHKPAALSPLSRDLDWSPDGRWLATSGVSVISAETGEITRMTHPPTGQNDIHASFSPDGHTLVFARDVGEGVTGIWLLPLSDGNKPAGEPRIVRLTGFETSMNTSPRWTPDGKDILLVSNHGGLNRLWRVSREGGTPVLLAGLGERLTLPALSRRGGRLAYCRRSYDTNIWRITVPPPGDVRPVEPQRFIASTRTEDSPQFSPDGKRIAFVSTRSGYDEIWTCDRNGENASQLTDLKANNTGSPRWSPDGHYIAFDSRAAGQAEIYMMPAEGGAPRRLTNDPAADVLASWSPDGKSIYFASNRGGDMQIWKMPAAGGTAHQVTAAGGFASAFSPDGKWMYYTKPGPHSAVWRIPANGGEPVVIHESICDRCFAPSSGGLFLVESRSGEASASLMFYPTEGRPSWIARLSHTLMPGLAVSPDGRELLFSEVDQDAGNLMLVENFR